MEPFGVEKPVLVLATGELVEDAGDTARLRLIPRALGFIGVNIGFSRDGSGVAAAGTELDALKVSYAWSDMPDGSGRVVGKKKDAAEQRDKKD